MHTANMVSTRDAAALLGTDRNGVRRLLRSGDLEPALKLDGKTGAYLFDREVVEALAKARQGATS